MRQPELVPFTPRLWTLAAALAGTCLGGLACGQSAPAQGTGGTVRDGAALEEDGGACITPRPEDFLPPGFFADTGEGDNDDRDGAVIVVGDGDIVLEPGGVARPPDGGIVTVEDGGPPAPTMVGPGPAGPANVLGPSVPANLDNEFGRGANQFFPNPTGFNDLVDGSVGSNGRHCETCHSNDGQWSMNPENLQKRFETGLSHFSRDPRRFPSNDTAASNDALEPIFRTVDGANSPTADVSTPAARRSAYSLLLARAVIRVGLPIPDDADFELVAVDDPYRFASARQLSLFRRPLPMANLRFNTTLMWDGRETVPCGTLSMALHNQASHAIADHAQGAVPVAPAKLTAMVEDELAIYFAQRLHMSAGRLNQDGGRGGPNHLVKTPFYFGINAFSRLDPKGKPYTSEVFTLYRAWRDRAGDSAVDRARAQIALGEHLFNSREFVVRGVSGFNDELERPEVRATCGACHNTPNVGTNSEGRLMDIGVSDGARRAPELPLYTFRERATGEITTTTDPGQALVSRKWAHIGRFKVPGLRALAGRPPYLHDGSAKSLGDAIDHHERRFAIGLTATERDAMVAFLSAL